MTAPGLLIICLKLSCKHFGSTRNALTSRTKVNWKLMFPTSLRNLSLLLTSLYHKFTTPSPPFSLSMLALLATKFKFQFLWKDMGCLSINAIENPGNSNKINKTRIESSKDESVLEKPPFHFKVAKKLFIVSTIDCHSGAWNARIQSINDITFKRTRCQVTSLPSSYPAKWKCQRRFASEFIVTACLYFSRIQIKFLGHQYHIFEIGISAIKCLREQWRGIKSHRM